MADVESFWQEEPSELIRVRPGFRLDEQSPDSKPGFAGDKKDAQAALAEGAGILSELQEMFFADSTADGGQRVLVVLQAMDTAGKGGIVRHVMGAVDPAGIRYRAFKAPTKEELSHDFLWRVRKELPAAGQIGVFDRSHYEDVLIGRVRSLAPPAEIERRYGAINEFERELAADGTVIVKVMLHISSDEQKRRLAARLERPEKQWKYNPGDVTERLRWNDYQAAYQRVFDETTTPEAPWYVVPANRKWYARLAVQHLLIDALRSTDPQWPAPDYDVELEKARLAAS
ncbi:MAG: PPK2 family polyphosphate kinase [Leifsonia sp.]